MSKIFTRILVQIIRFYQKYLSPDHSFWARAAERPPYCKHIPSCSDYMIESIEKKGLFKGVLKGIWRIFRCNPWSKGGYDPVEENSWKSLDVKASSNRGK